MSKKTQEVINELNKDLAQGDIFKFHDVDYIEVEVLQMPVISLCVDYLWRFSKPFSGVLNLKPIKVSHLLDHVVPLSHEDILKKAVLLEWKDMIRENGGKTTEKTALALINKWNNITDVRIEYLKLVRDDSK